MELLGTITVFIVVSTITLTSVGYLGNLNT